MTHWFKVLIVVLLFALIVPVHAESNDCEKLAKDYQRIYWGDLILVQPLIPNSGGAYESGAYSGHWMNRAWNKEIGNYYYDLQEKTYYFSISSINKDFSERWNKKVEILNYNRGEVSFDIIWHY